VARSEALSVVASGGETGQGPCSMLAPSQDHDGV
jgi:hypothetical protein